MKKMIGELKEGDIFRKNGDVIQVVRLNYYPAFRSLSANSWTSTNFYDNEDMVEVLEFPKPHSASLAQELALSILCGKDEVGDVLLDLLMDNGKLDEMVCKSIKHLRSSLQNTIALGVLR